MDFRNLPIKRKLTAVIMLTSTVVLLVTASAFIAYEIFNIRHNLRTTSEATAVIAAEEGSAAVTARNQKAAAEILSHFGVRKQILLSAFYLTNGEILASYPKTAPREAFPATAVEHGYEISGRTVNIFVPVLQSDRLVGVMYIKWDLSLQYQRFAWYGGLVAAILAGSLAIALGISHWLQGLISRPILELAQTAKAVAVNKDYRVRAAKFGEDELGVLTDAFNLMLTQIQEREAALRESEAQLRAALQAAEASAAQVRALNADLERRVTDRTTELASANHELEAFTYSVSHDLRAPLRHIDAFAKILEEEQGATPPAQMRNYLARIRKGAQNMGQLVDDLLNLSRMGRATLKNELLDLNLIIDDVRAESRPDTDGRNIEWRIARLPPARGDAGLVKQIFANLISNAIKYTRPRQNPRIEIGAAQADGRPAIFIRDNGVGFNMKYADKIFGVFQRLHREEDFEGTGVGLATVKRIVEMQGGRIWVEAELDKGAAFYFTLGGLQSA